MAVLAELFLVLAGFDSGLDEQKLQHPAELEVFDRARWAGQRFSVLRDACAARDDAVAKTVESLVVQRYLVEIANLESETLAELSKVAQLPFRDALFRSAEIMNRSVERWQRRFDLALQLLTELDPRLVSVAQSIEEVAVAARLHAGFSDVYELCNKCVEALDFQWLSDLKVRLTTFEAGDEDASELSLHPSLEGSSGAVLLANATNSLRQLASQHAVGVEGLILEFLDVADKNARLIDTVNVPVTAERLLPVLRKVHLNIHSLVKSRIMHAKSVRAMLIFLRDILLFGSSDFVDEFCSAQGHTSTALDRFCDANPEFVTEVYAHVDSMIRLRTDSANLKVEWPLSLLFTADQCVVYCSIHSTFAAIVLAMNSIGPGQGPVMHRYHLFLAMLWSEFQNSVHAAFTELRNAIDSDQDLSVQSTQSRILRDLVTRMSLDSSSIRARLQLITEHVSARSETTKPIRDLAIALSHLPMGRDLPLRPFVDAEDV